MAVQTATGFTQGHPAPGEMEQNVQKLFGTAASTCKPQTSHVAYFGD